MESCLARAQFDKCNCSDAKYAGFVDGICYDTDERKCFIIINNKAKWVDIVLSCNVACKQSGYYNKHYNKTWIKTLILFLHRVS